MYFIWGWGGGCSLPSSPVLLLPPSSSPNLTSPLLPSRHNHPSALRHKATAPLGPASNGGHGRLGGAVAIMTLIK
ncbi:hypothetical protein E2C01_101101 [Portunus trituberculatus]|uniref:Uncharacterized protein n=1 Tax=Portunus trituberculatus TaxID=210409 RepID=A0A5B7K4U5_PORTR|nr:hypothetical protein [Portunus trituberculatus]